MPSSPQGRLPDFLIVGAPRSGTSSLHAMLRSHPALYLPAQKEFHHFISDFSAPGFIRDPSAYRGAFRDASPGQLVGEASPWYLYSTSAAAAIAEARPDARIIAMLRDPVEMLHSLHARYLFTRNEDIADLAAALDAEPDRAAGRRIPAGAPFREGLLYSRIGRLGEQLQRFVDRFPAGRIHVIRFERFRDDTLGAYADALGFLGVDAGHVPDLTIRAPYRRARSRAVSGAIYSAPWSLRRLAGHILPASWRLRLRSTGAFRALNQLNDAGEPRPPVDPAAAARLRDALRDDAARLGRLLGTDVAAEWWGDGEALTRPR